MNQSSDQPIAAMQYTYPHSTAMALGRSDPCLREGGRRDTIGQ
jgi:hypothetical protein